MAGILSIIGGGVVQSLLSSLLTTDGRNVRKISTCYWAADITTVSVIMTVRYLILRLLGEGSHLGTLISDCNYHYIHHHHSLQTL